MISLIKGRALDIVSKIFREHYAEKPTAVHVSGWQLVRVRCILVRNNVWVTVDRGRIHLLRDLSYVALGEKRQCYKGRCPRSRDKANYCPSSIVCPNENGLGGCSWVVTFLALLRSCRQPMMIRRFARSGEGADSRVLGCARCSCRLEIAGEHLLTPCTFVGRYVFDDNALSRESSKGKDHKKNALIDFQGSSARHKLCAFVWPADGDGDGSERALGLAVISAGVGGPGYRFDFS